MLTASPTVAVVDGAEDGIVVWHANLSVWGSGAGGRLTGAWLLPLSRMAEIRSVVAAKSWLPTATGEKALAQLGLVPGQGVVSLESTVEAVRQERARLEAAFDDEQARRDKSKQLVELSLPPVPVPPAAWAAVEGAAPEVGVALAIGQWLARLADAWSEMETQRTARVFLRDLGGASLRPLPVTLV